MCDNNMNIAMGLLHSTASAALFLALADENEKKTKNKPNSRMGKVLAYAERVYG